MKSFIVALLLIFLTPNNAQAYLCPPCTVCGLTSWGGIIYSVQQLPDYIRNGLGEGIKKTGYKYQKDIQKVKKNVADFAKNASEKISSFKKELAGGLSDLTNEEKEENEAEDSNPPKDASTKDRIERNAKLAETERKTGVSGEDDFLKRRTFMRQQALLTYMARTLEAKQKLNQIQSIVKEIDERVQKSASAASNTKILESDGNKENKSKTTNDTAQLNKAMNQLLKIQHQLNSIRLEYRARVKLATQPPVKAKIEIDSSSSSEKK